MDTPILSVNHQRDTSSACLLDADTHGLGLGEADVLRLLHALALDIPERPVRDDVEVAADRSRLVLRERERVWQDVERLTKIWRYDTSVAGCADVDVVSLRWFLSVNLPPLPKVSNLRME